MIFVADMVIRFGRYGLFVWPMWLWPIWFVADMVVADMVQTHFTLCSLQRFGEGKGLDTCYSSAYMSQTSDQQRFTILQMAADWHEPMVLQRIMTFMWAFISHSHGHLDPWCS